MTTASTTTEPAAAATATTRVLVADKLEQVALEGLQRIGCLVESSPNLTPETLPAAVADLDPEVLVVRSTKVPEPVFESAGRLALVVRAGAGYDNIDVPAASRRGVFVANCPGKNAIAVAELVFGLILACDRRIPDQTIDLRAGTWNKKGYGKGARGLYGRTLGIVGMGQIGRAVAERGRGFGMRVVAWSRSLTQQRADELGVHYCSSMINLAKMADFVSVNIAATEDTAGLIDDAFFQAMKDGGVFINTSRGTVVDSEALVRATRDKNISAGLDVYGHQPGPSDTEFADPVVQAPGVYGTHHCGASTEQAQHAVAAEVVTIVETWRDSGEVPHCVNRAAATPATTLLTVRHLNRPGVLAHVFYTLGQAGINVEEMENVIYAGHEAACARIQLDAPPEGEHLQAIGANDNVLSIDITSLNRDDTA